jgi:hypothetical protein
MSYSDLKKTVMRCLILMLMSLALIMFSKDSTKALLVPLQVTRNDTQLPKLVQANQEDSPLRIVNAFVETPSPEKVVVRVMVQNQSNKEIRALAIAADTRVDFLNLLGRASILKPSQIKTFDIVYTRDGRPKRINLSVDFVEFGDGMTWGSDIGNSRDKLAGQRTGAKEERERLKSLFKSKGRSYLTNILEAEDSDELEPSKTANHSSAWLQGYRNGVMSIRYRVRQSLQGSPEQLKVALDSPYDTSEDNKQ